MARTVGIGNQDFEIILTKSDYEKFAEEKMKELEMARKMPITFDEDCSEIFLTLLENNHCCIWSYRQSVPALLTLSSL